MMPWLSIVLAAAIAALPIPQPFEPQMLGDTALSPAFSPDGQTMLFTRQANHSAIIMESHRIAGGWSQPQPASFSGQYADTDPAFGPDGSYVVFASARPVPGARAKALTLWSVRRNGASWGTPVHLPPNVNVAPYEFAPSIANDGTLYFMGSDAARRHQLYRARRLGDTAYETAQALPFSSPATKDADPLVAPDQSLVYFVSAGRSGPSDSNAHLYVARANGARWTVSPVAYQGESDDSDCCLTFGPGAKTILFTASRANTSVVEALPY